MDKANIERLVGERVRAAAEKAIVEVVAELNSAGHRFEAVGETLIDWREPESESQLSIYCTVGAVYRQAPTQSGHSDPDVEKFISRARSGRDRTATLLNQLEGGVANGGLYQTIENQGIEFLEECADSLRAIGAKATVRIVSQAAEVWRKHQATLDDYAELRKKLGKLDKRFWALKESIPVLYERTNSNA
ncbi:MAG: DUF4375 domain-containing protein [Usitatibacteraceae bacterium]